MVKYYAHSVSTITGIFFFPLQQKLIITGKGWQEKNPEEHSAFNKPSEIQICQIWIAI